MTSSFVFIIAILFSQNVVPSPCKEKPTVTLSFFSPITVNEGDNFTCVCKGNKTIVGTEKGSQTLTLNNVNGTVSGTYKCVAQSYNQTDEKLKEKVRLNCTTPSKDTSSRTEWYIRAAILVAGIIIGILFSCIVSSCRHWCRNRKSERNPESQITEVDTTYQDIDLTELNTEDNCQSLGNRKSQSNPEPQETEADDADPTYQKLDLSKMDTEDKYQPLKVNAASNDVATDDDASYTELDETSDAESNYQSINV